MSLTGKEVAQMLPVTGEDMQQRSVVQMGSYTL